MRGILDNIEFIYSINLRRFKKMANSKQILAKLARNAAQLGLTVNSQSATQVVIENGSNDLTLSYVDASIASPQGGVDPSVSPYLGIGVGNPGKVKIKSAVNAATSMADIIDSEVAAKVLAMCAALANNIVLENSDASFSAEVRGHADLIGLGQ
jgi:hypothetical protein